MTAAVTREELIAAATVLHDQEGCSCDRKYLMSCPQMANAILRSGPAARAFSVGDRVRVTGKGHPHRGQRGTISAPFSSASAPDLQWTVSLDNWAEAAVSEREIRHAP